jgi:hypothetical protein
MEHSMATVSSLMRYLREGAPRASDDGGFVEGWPRASIRQSLRH